MSKLSLAQEAIRDQLVVGGMDPEAAATIAATVNPAAVATAVKAERKAISAEEEARAASNADRLRALIGLVRDAVLSEGADWLPGTQLDVRVRSGEDGTLSVAFHGSPKGIKTPVLIQTDGSEYPTTDRKGDAIPSATRRAETFRPVTGEREKRK
jgi:hypothetical protein